MDQKMLFTIDPTQMALVFNMILLFMLACMMNSGMFCLSFWLSGVYFVCVYTFGICFISIENGRAVFKFYQVSVFIILIY